MEVGRGGHEAALDFDQTGHGNADALQAITRETRGFTHLFSQSSCGRDSPFRIGMHGGHFTTNADFTARVGQSHRGGLDTKTDAEIRRRRVVELEQTRSTPTTGNGLSVANFLHDATGEQVFDNRRDGRFSQSGSARQVCAGDSAATTNDVEDDRAVDLAHCAAIDLPLDVMLHGCSPGACGTSSRSSVTQYAFAVYEVRQVPYRCKTSRLREPVSGRISRRLNQ